MTTFAEMQKAGEGQLFVNMGGNQLLALSKLSQRWLNGIYVVILNRQLET